MRIEHLQTALDRTGGDLTRWPAAERAEVEALMARDARAAALVAAARRLDGVLAEAVRPMTVDAAFVGRIIAGMGDGLHHDVAIRPTPRLFAWAGVAVVAFLVTGYAVGLALPASQGEDAFAGLIFGNSTSSDASGASDSGSAL